MEQQAIKDTQLKVNTHSNGKTNSQIDIKKTRNENIYEPNQQTTTPKHQVPDKGQAKTIASGLNTYKKTGCELRTIEFIIQ